MKKVGVKKDISSNRVIQPTSTEKILVENFASLQKVMTNLSEKFTDLSSQISKLVGLFEVSARTLAEKGFTEEKEILKKLDSLIDQNKIIAQGVSLLHEEPEVSSVPPMRPPIKSIPVPAQKLQVPQKQIPMQKPLPKQASNIEEYQKSISS
ncbi:hypothetical protein ACFLZF_00600 [Nanoarchaeota archaeon]